MFIKLGDSQGTDEKRMDKIRAVEVKQLLQQQQYTGWEVLAE